MILIALDSSGPSASVALLQDEKILFEEIWLPTTSHTSEMALKVEQALKQTGIGLEDIEAFALSQGPGSFTGLRVGLGLVKGLAFRSNKPVMGISTLKALAYPIQDFKTLIPFIDARRDEVYGACFERSSQALKTILSDRAQNPREFLIEVKNELADKQISLAFFGSGARRYQKELREIFVNQGVILSEDFDRVRASSVGRLGFEAFHRGDFSLGGEDLTPNYLRESEPEIQKKRLDV